MKDIDVLPQQRRENPEPREDTQPVPWAVLALVGALLAFGVVYIARSNVDTPSAWGDGRGRDELAGAAARSSSGTADGAAIFASTCAACHQPTGTGLAGVFPPLAGSEWVRGSDETLAAIVLRGISGRLTVNGTTYDGQMPPFRDALDDEKLAAVLTHLRSSWGNASPPVSAATVAAARARLAAGDAPFAGDKDLAPAR